MSVYTLASRLHSVESEVDDIASNTNTKVGGSGTATRLSKFTASKTLADSSIQETVSPSGGSISVGNGGRPDINYRIRIQGDLIVDDNPGSALGWGIALTTDSDFSNRPLITRKKDAFNSGRYSAFVGRWGLFMETNDLFLASPGTDGPDGDPNRACTVSIGGWHKSCVPEPNLTVNHLTRMVGIGTTTPVSKLHVNGKITAVSCQTDTIYALDNTVYIKDAIENTMVYVQSNNMYVTGSLYVGGVQITASDRRLKFNEKPLVNSLAVINRLEPVEYDQTHMLVDQYTSDTPQYHQCGFIAQSVEQIDELRHVVLGGVMGEDGKDSLRGLNYNALFTYAVKAIQELSKIVEAQQAHIDKYMKNNI
jgi:hypothetical protein